MRIEIKILIELLDGIKVEYFSELRFIRMKNKLSEEHIKTEGCGNTSLQDKIVLFKIRRTLAMYERGKKIDRQGVTENGSKGKKISGIYNMLLLGAFF